MMDLGTRIKVLREDAGLTQIAFAKILNISNSALSQYESGDRIPSDATKIKIADHFDISLDYLLGRTEQKQNVSMQFPKGISVAEEELISVYRTASADDRAIIDNIVRRYVKDTKTKTSA